LLNKSLNKPINITFNYKVYNLYITDGLGNTDFIIKGLSTDSKIENVFGKVAQKLVESGKHLGLNENDIM
jgi:hypothetical protein